MRRVSAPSDRVAVVGAGTSRLIPELIAAGYRTLTGIDISQTALDRLRTELGPRADSVRLLCEDMRRVRLDPLVAVWHDRAAYHFLLDADDRAAYVRSAAAAVAPGGHLVMAEFAAGGPDRCSGLPVARQTAESLGCDFGDDFELIEAFEREHTTPRGVSQLFIHAVLRRHAPLGAGPNAGTLVTAEAVEARRSPRPP